MTTQRWKAAGWLCILLAVVFAAVAIVLVFRGGSGFVPSGGVAIDIVPSVLGTLPVNLLRSIVFGVLAGVAFFTGLACFFWSAAVVAREQRAEIIRLLENQATTGS
ncbi:MAG TPA: hypothetical protein VHF06_38010 [Pseudonocardiaceae bacterium]|jgi:hypothetical protein|nr:hypothetical protein [Pseudonocardiaceae bacterium]